MLSILVANVLGCQTILINDFQNFPNNNIQGVSGDDRTMLQVLPQKDTQTVQLISVTPQSFYYETGFCPNFRQDYRTLELQVTSSQPATWFTINFQTADQCSGPVTNNYVKPFLTGANLTAGSQTTMRIDVPPGIGNRLVAISIEDLQPLASPVIFGKMRMSCAPGTGPQEPPKNAANLPAIGILSLIALFV
jgi:hypothetical protein